MKRLSTDSAIQQNAFGMNQLEMYISISRFVDKLPSHSIVRKGVVGVSEIVTKRISGSDCICHQWPSTIPQLSRSDTNLTLMIQWSFIGFIALRLN